MVYVVGKTPLSSLYQRPISTHTRVRVLFLSWQTYFSSSQIVIDGRDGILYEPHNMEDAARALRECIEKETVLRKGNRARAEKVRFFYKEILSLTRFYLESILKSENYA